jgi:hypothetical protein
MAKIAAGIAQNPSPLLKVEISQDASSGQSLRRKVKVQTLTMVENAIMMKHVCNIVNKNSGDDIPGKAYAPSEYLETYYCDERGPFVDPVTHLIISGTLDTNNQSPTFGQILYPNNTITRFKDIMKAFDGIPVVSQKDLLTIVINELDTVIGRYNQ